MARASRGFGRDTTWDEIGWQEYEGGARTSSLVLGDADDPSAPVIFTGEFPPGYRVEPHHHVTDYVEILLEGSQQITKVWHQAGAVRIVRRGTGYGPLIAGPQGCRTIVVFRDQNWMSHGGPAMTIARTASQEVRT